MLNPARRSTGNRQIDWITMPSVVPMASSSMPPVEMVCGVRFSPSVRMNSPPTMMTTTLLMTGVHMLAPNRPLVFRIAPSSESIP